MDWEFEWLKSEVLLREVRGEDSDSELRWTIVEETIRTQKGHAPIVRKVLHHPGVCVIVPFVAPDTIVLIKQFRYSFRDQLWELPAGTMKGIEMADGRIHAIETPEDCARRELPQEAKYNAASFDELPIQCYSMPGTSDQLLHFVAARELTPLDHPLDIGEVIIEIDAFNARQLRNLIRSNEIRDAKTLLALFHVLGNSIISTH